MFSTKSLILIVLTLFLVGCTGSQSATEAVTETIEPTSTVLRPQPSPPPTEPAVVDGEQIYLATCAPCHSLDERERNAMGLGGLFTMESFSDGQPFSEETLGELILQGTGVGVGAMPASRLNATELAALITYLREATR